MVFEPCRLNVVELVIIHLTFTASEITTYGVWKYLLLLLVLLLLLLFFFVCLSVTRWHPIKTAEYIVMLYYYYYYHYHHTRK